MTTSSITPIAATVRKARSEDVVHLCDTLGTAFFADPVMSWCFPDPDRRRQILPDFFRTFVAASLPYGGAYTVSDVRAGALWMPPEAELDEDQLAADLVDVAGDDAQRVLTLLEFIEREHPTDDPHQYLAVLGAQPQWQSHGLGSALLRAVLDPCDEDGTPAYLEATGERNRRLYLRHGFEVRTTVRLPDGPPVWCMWREPR